jgi:hypothetical protein
MVYSFVLNIISYEYTIKILQNVKQVIWGWAPAGGERANREGRRCIKYLIQVHENKTIKSVEVVLRGEGDEENDTGDEFDRDRSYPCI